jgi:hypothetical protein
MPGREDLTGYLRPMTGLFRTGVLLPIAGNPVNVVRDR